MRKKQVYQQPQIKVLTIHTESLLVGFSGGGYGGQQSLDWPSGDE